MSVELIQVNNIDDIELYLYLKDVDGAPIPFAEFNWKIQLYVNPLRKFEISRWDGILSEEVEIYDGFLLIRIPAFDWKYSGNLNVKLIASYENTSFPDGKFDSSTVPVELPIEILNV